MDATLLIGTRKGLFTCERVSSGWRVARVSHLGHPCTYAFHDRRTGVLWASLDHGHWGNKLHRSTDRGETWSDDLAPAYPEDALYNGKPAKMDLLWVVAPGGADQPDRLYLGTNPGGLFRSDDGGNSFHLVRGLWSHPSREKWFGGGRDTPGIHSVWVDPRDSRRVLVAVSCAGVFETTDDGETWNPTNTGLKADFLPDPTAPVGQDPHFMTSCREHPDALWQQNHCGIFRSTDGGHHWEEVSEDGGPARFGFPVVVHPTDPDVAWVVPAVSDETRVAVGGAMCVCRTDDGGKTWVARRAGLPQEHAYDVVYRHAFDRDDTADTLALGTTTGNVYVSDDGGEHWSALSHHLPPVYSVRFA